MVNSYGFIKFLEAKIDSVDEFVSFENINDGETLEDEIESIDSKIEALESRKDAAQERLEFLQEQQ
ncbi:MAG: hypothetical protein ACFFDN_24445 [Candidatus Hodarchaeota archaeon]